MQELYDYRRIRLEPRSWRAAAEAILDGGAERVEAAGGVFFGLWQGQIGIGANEGVVITCWPDRESLADHAGLVTRGIPAVAEARGDVLIATARPTSPVPPQAAGVYAHRWFSLGEKDWDEFRELSEQAWPAFESFNEARVVGLFRRLQAPAGRAEALLLTWYASLAAWEGSRADRADREETRDAARLFMRRHELTSSTIVATTRLLVRTPGASAP